jgi:hypothetical protein
MNLGNSELPPLPNREAIGPPEDAEELDFESKAIECSLPSEIQKNLHHDVLEKYAKVTEILMKHLKIPLWQSSVATSKNITILCNFQHEFTTSLENILDLNVRCTECRTKIDEISQIIYTKESQLKQDAFKIIRINRFGQLVIRCVSKNHKIRIPYNIQLIQESNDIPKYCPECIVENSSPSSKTSNMSDEIEFAKSLQNISIHQEDDSMDDWENFFKYDSYLHEGGNKDEDTFENPDFDLCDTPTGYAIETDSDSEQFTPGSRKNSDEYEDYFDNIEMSDDEFPPVSLLTGTSEEEIREELENPQINYIVSATITRNHEQYLEQKEKALTNYKKNIQ